MRGEAWLGLARRARPGEAWLGLARRARQGEARRGGARLGKAGMAQKKKGGEDVSKTCGQALTAAGWALILLGGVTADSASPYHLWAAGAVIAGLLLAAMGQAMGKEKARRSGQKEEENVNLPNKHSKNPFSCQL